MKSSVAVLLVAVSVFGQPGRRPQAAAPATGAPVVTVEGMTDDEGVVVEGGTVTGAPRLIAESDLDEK